MILIALTLCAFLNRHGVDGFFGGNDNKMSFRRAYPNFPPTHAINAFLPKTAFAARTCLSVAAYTPPAIANGINLTDRPSSSSFPALMEPEVPTRQHSDDDPSPRFPNPWNIGFVAAEDVTNNYDDDFEEEMSTNDDVPLFVNMLRGSGSYIAEHLEEVAVFHIPGELIDTEGFSNLMDDIALSWLLGIRIVIVLGDRFSEDVCPAFSHGHECQNTLRVTDEKTIQAMEEDAGFVRFEVERQLNRRLRLNNGQAGADRKDAPAPNGNVLSGNYYTAQRFGNVHGVDYQFAGVPNRVHAEKIKQAHEKNDVVLLTTVSNSRSGDLVNVNGNHLAAYVAASLGASKLVYFSTEGTVLVDKATGKHIQDLPLSIAKSLVDHYNVQMHQAGFASFEEAQEVLDPPAVEKLLNLGWSSWALENGVKRAHIVGPGDGALLEELFSAKEGANTCIMHDDDGLEEEEETMQLEGFPSFAEHLNNKEERKALVTAQDTPPFS